MTRGTCLALVVIAATFAGCAKMRAPWTKRTPKGAPPTQADIYSNRQEELKTLAETIGEKDAAEQDRIAAQLQQEMSTEQNPVMRMAIIRPLGEMKSPVALAALQQALRDTDKSVRIKVCDALAQRKDAEAAKALSEVVASDADLDVRMAAARGLGEINDPQAVQGLGLALGDADPALQRRAIESLRNVTDRDFGNSVPAWREFVAGGSPPEVEPTLAERMRRIF